jgi:hypothetical protein
VEAFLALEKTLSGPPPIWNKSDWGGEWVATWPILDPDGSPIAVLHCCSRIADTSVAGLNLIFRSRPVWRVHIDGADVCHSNLHDAHFLKLPAVVCGPHEHAWPINKKHILEQDIWDLPYRSQIAAKRLNAALPLLADQINLTLTPEQRAFDGPTRADLFDKSGA